MPIYEYRCPACTKEFEELVMSRDEAVRCPACGRPEVERTLSAFSFASGGTFSSSQGSGCGPCMGRSCASCKPSGG